MDEYKEEFDKLLDHDYDGIKELDNNLPRWWLYLFYFTIIFGVIYYVYYHVISVGYLQDDEYRLEMDPNYKRISEADRMFLGVIPEYHSPLEGYRPDITPWSLTRGDEETAYVEVSRESDTIIYIALTDPADLSAGTALFVKNCVQCHGKLGEGGIGPNLTDNYWLHGASYTEIVKSVKYGYPAKGMIAWRGFLKEEQILQVTSFLQTLKGTNPPNAKAPQGELVSE